MFWAVLFIFFIWNHCCKVRMYSLIAKHFVNKLLILVLLPVFVNSVNCTITEIFTPTFLYMQYFITVIYGGFIILQSIFLKYFLEIIHKNLKYWWTNNAQRWAFKKKKKKKRLNHLFFLRHMFRYLHLDKHVEYFFFN